MTFQVSLISTSLYCPSLISIPLPPPSPPSNHHHSPSSLAPPPPTLIHFQQSLQLHAPPSPIRHQPTKIISPLPVTATIYHVHPSTPATHKHQLPSTTVATITTISYSTGTSSGEMLGFDFAHLRSQFTAFVANQD
ncbi:hypothetical protein L1987_18753 [Smallanthus sonchifolius]|uniref:Uncharacterized protein n=1 Tax=Smallanthus sonchifolius TaxID=185202 RepID=A0ACB9J0H1_9ASTR|nr:hypothetical protein L1987_18753 [Smallanthus sonchifolius]